MDTLDTYEELMDEIDIQTTEVDFGEDLERDFDDQEYGQEQEGFHEQEAGIDENNGEEKEETLSGFISANRGGNEEFKLEYEGTFIVSTLTEEQKTAQADLLASLSASSGEAVMLPDYVSGKTIYFTAARMDGEGNIQYEIRSFTSKEEEGGSPVEEVGGEMTQETAETVQIEEQDPYTSSETDQVAVEEAVVTEEARSETVSFEESVAVDHASLSEQPMAETREDAEKSITQRIIDLFREEQQPEPVQETPVVTSATEQTIHTKPGEILTLEDKILELFKDEPETKEVVPEQTKMPEVRDIQREQVVVDMDIKTDTKAETITKVETHETAQAPLVEAVQAQNLEPAEQALPDIKAEIVTEAQVREPVQVPIVESIQAQSPEPVEQARFEKADIIVKKDEGESASSQKIEIVETSRPIISETVDVSKEISVDTKERAEVRNPEVVIEEAIVEDAAIAIEAIVDVSRETSEQRPVLNEVVKEAVAEKAPIVDHADVKVKPEKAIVQKTKANDMPLRSAEKTETAPRKEAPVAIKSAKPIVEKKAIAQGRKEAIVLNIGRSKVDRVVRGEAPVVSFERPKEEGRIREESPRPESLDGREILLRVLGISRNTIEARSVGPTNLRSSANTNQEEQEAKSTRSKPRAYRQGNMNGITLRIAA